MSEVANKPQCHHIMDSGLRCATPPVKGKNFCYHHLRWHTDFILPGHPEYVPPLLDSRHSIQLALHHIYLALSKNLLDARLARTMLGNLRLAQQNLGQEDCMLPFRYCETEINAPMRQVLHLDENLQDTHLRDASPDAHRSSDTAARTAPIRMGVNNTLPILPETDSTRAVERSNRLATYKISPDELPAFVPELEPDEWLRITRDLPRKGEPGTAQQQLNCRRVLQILNYDGMRRRMAGVKNAG